MDLFVSLPSNTKGLFYTNKTSEFTTLLAKPIKFDYPTKVGLSEIIYTSKWEVFLGNIYLQISDLLHKIPIYIVDRSSFKDVVSSINNSIIKYFFEEELSKKQQNILFISEQLKSSPKEDEKQIIDKISSDNIIKDLVKINTPQITFDNNRLSFEKFGDYVFWFTDHLEKVFGNSKYTKDSSDLYVIKDAIVIVTALYVYTDIIDYQYVGDTLAPLLRNVAVVDQNGTVSVTYNSPDYLKINKSEINKIYIKITDEEGNNIRFINGKVIVKLNFKSDFGL